MQPRHREWRTNWRSVGSRNKKDRWRDRLAARHELSNEIVENNRPQPGAALSAGPAEDKTEGGRRQAATEDQGSTKRNGGAELRSEESRGTNRSCIAEFSDSATKMLHCSAKVTVR